MKTKGKATYELLVIDDDQALNELLTEYFASFGHRLWTATTALAGRQLLRMKQPDLLILDVMLPDADGLELCRTLRAQSDLPIVMLTARGDLPDRVLGLEFGADDYVPKPFEPRELVARVEGLLRRRVRCRPSLLGSKTALLLDLGARSALLDGSPLELTTLEFDLLAALVANAGRVLSRNALLRAAHGTGTEAFDRSIDMVVSRLRKKLDDPPRSPRFIKTLRGAGYQFIGPTDAA